MLIPKKNLKKIIKNQTIQDLLVKYNISTDYTSLRTRMVARGVFLGLFIAMIPMPFQMFAVFLFTFVGRFNFPIAIAMCWITNPFSMPFIYYIEYLTGAFFLNIEPQDVQMSIEWFNENLDTIVVPLYFGALVYSLLLSTMGYYLMSYCWKCKNRRRSL